MRSRTCGTCTLCCRLLPVHEGIRVLDARTGNARDMRVFDKPAMTRCPHQCSAGCRIYEDRPDSCRLWSCAWLEMPEAEDLPRPDRCHYVVDPLPDVVRVTDDETGRVFLQPCVQVWIDPDYPDCHREPRLRAYLDKMARDHGMIAVIRGGAEKNRKGQGLSLVPPSLPSNSERKWLEVISPMTEPFMSDKEKLSYLAEEGLALDFQQEE